MKGAKAPKRCRLCGTELNENSAHRRQSSCKACDRDRLAAHEFKKRAKKKGVEWATAHVARTEAVLGIIKKALEEMSS